VTSAVGYISLKYQKGWVEKVQVKVQRKKKQK